MLHRTGVEAEITRDPSKILAARKLILPGVGAFDAGMSALRDLGLLETLNHKARVDRVPILGICLGMQLFARRSEEGVEPGLGWLDAEVVRFKFSSSDTTHRVPHMGWNTVASVRPSALLQGLEPEARFYFVHSFHVQCRPEDVLTLTTHGYPFPSMVQRENILGVQFHPEKSHRFGMRILSNFATG